MPQRPTDPRRHAPGLDGIRALAVAAVVAYHLGVPGLNGGFLGVSVFFTLSGYLITSILVSEFAARGAIDFAAFWGRRARRLLPAAWSVLATVLLTATLTRASKLRDWAYQALAAFLYVANWSTIVRGDDYFSQFAGPSPLEHLWSLAIEEQFYLIWPVFALGFLRMAHRRGTLAPTLLGTAALTLASSLMLAWFHRVDVVNNTRAYEGTDTRAAALLVGALAAWTLPFDALASRGRTWARALDALGAACLAAVVALFVAIDDRSAFFYRGGELLLAVATAGWVLAAAHPDTFAGRLLGVAPLRWLGERSYGIYLWHMPVIALSPGAVLADRALARGALQVALTVGLAALSHALLEDPIRRRRPLDVRRLAGMALVVPLATLSLAAWPRRRAAVAFPGDPQLATPSPDGSPEPLDASASAQWAGRTSCRTTIHVGDSTSTSLVSADFIPRVDEQLAARYRAVGVEAFVADISSGRSILERWNGEANAWDLVHDRRRGNYRGCWVFALGNNDAANTKGNLISLAQRIDWLMAQVDGRPVLWTTTRSLLPSGKYDAAHLHNWNRALAEACARHVNMRVFDWAAETRDEWFLPDLLHPTPRGAWERARRLALALARAFPEDAPPSRTCFVRSDR